MKKRILAALLVIGAGLGAWWYFKPATAPTLHSIERTAIKTWNRLDPYYTVPHESVNCDYDPSRFKPSYQFVCHIYDGKNFQIGKATFTVEAGGNSSDGWPMNITTEVQ